MWHAIGEKLKQNDLEAEYVNLQHTEPTNACIWLKLYFDDSFLCLYFL